MSSGEQLLARLGLDTSGFKAALKDAHSSFTSFASKLGVGVSIAGFANEIQKLLEYGKRIDDLSKRYDVNAEALQRLGNAAELNGSSLEGVAKGFNKLEIAQSRALAGNESLLKSFLALGINVDDLRKLSPEEILVKIGKSSMNAADLVKVLGKSALDLRPVLAGLADGTIQYGKAISDVDIKQLKEADATWKTTGQTIEILTGKILAFNIAQGMSAQKSAAQTYYDILHGNFSKFVHDMVATAKAEIGILVPTIGAAAGTVKGLLEDDKKSGGDTGKRRKFASTGEGKSKAELDAEKKERERDQLSLKDLQTEGAQFGKRNADGTVTANTGTPQMIYAAQQARLVEQLEGQAKQVRLTGFSPTGETSGQLLSRADAIRQTLPIKESEKDVGIYRQAFKDALSDTNEKLDDVIANTE
jgi:hypothetical protein